MATLLYRLGRFAYRRAALVITVWVIALAAALGVGLSLGGQTDESFSIPGTESQEALDQLDQLFPEAAGTTVQAVVAPEDDSLVTDADIRGEIDALMADLESIPGVETVLGPFDEFASNQRAGRRNHIDYILSLNLGEVVIGTCIYIHVFFNEVVISAIAKASEKKDGDRFFHKFIGVRGLGYSTGR